MKFILVLTIALAAHAADSREAEVTTASNGFDKCWDAHDVACLSKIVTDDFIMISRNAKIVDRAEFLDGMKAGTYAQRASQAQTHDLKVRFYGNTAIQTQIANQTLPIGRLGTPNHPAEPVDHFFTLVWVKIDGQGWRLASMHVSLPRQPAATK